MLRRREPGRWPDCETYPPGGGCGALAVLDGPGFSVRYVATALALEGVLEKPLVRWAARACDHAGAQIGEARTQAQHLARPPAAGRTGLAILPPSTLARTPHLASAGTRAEGRQQPLALLWLAKRGQREKCPALVLIAHAQASKRAAAGLPLGTQADTHRRCREVRRHFLGDKGSTEQKVPSHFAVAPAPKTRISSSRGRKPAAHPSGARNRAAGRR